MLRTEKQKFDLEKYKNLLRDDKFICFKEVLGRLLEPKSENRVGDLSVVIEEIKKIQHAHERKMNENFYGVHQNLKRISLKILWIFLFFIAGVSAVNFVYLQRMCYRGELVVELFPRLFSWKCKCNEPDVWSGDNCDKLNWNGTISNSHKVKGVFTTPVYNSSCVETIGIEVERQRHFGG